MIAELITTLLLIRHGQTDWNSQGRVQGHINIPLNEQGLAQAKDLAKKMELKHPDLAVIYSSDLDRAYETAMETAKKFDLSVEKRPLLRECHYGLADGLTYQEKDSRWGHGGLIPGAETADELLQRVQADLIEIASKHPGKKIAVFSHGRTIQTFVNSVFPECPRAIFNCTIVEMRYGPDFQFVGLENL